MNDPSPFATAILLAGGSGSRMGENTEDKVLLPIRGKPVLQYSIESFARSNSVDSLVIVFRNEAQKKTIERLVPRTGFRIVDWAKGGAKRQDSVWAGLSRLEPDCEVVLIHDGARPFAQPHSIDTVARAARKGGASSIARRVTDTLKEIEYSKNGYVLQTVDRSRIWAMETPQGFRKALIVKGYRDTIAEGNEITDDLSAVESNKQPVALIETDYLNPKLTTPDDIPLFEHLVERLAE